METIKKRLDFIEKYLRKRTPGVGVILRRDEKWRLYFNGQEADFPTEAEAISAFHRMAGPSATLILW